MTVEILNPEVLLNLYKNHGEFAAVCYNTDTKYAAKVGESCQQSGHMSGSRCEYIKFRISGIDRGTAEQILRHEMGVQRVPDAETYSDLSMEVTDVSPDQVIKNMASFRYIDKDGFEYAVPSTIAKDAGAKVLYDAIMKSINNYRDAIKQQLIHNGVPEARATQDANMVLPRATTTELVIGFTPEALIHFCHKRLCNRAQEFIREVARYMKTECAKVNPKFAEELVPHCKYLLWCPEGKKCCGMTKTRDEVASLINRVYIVE